MRPLTLEDVHVTREFPSFVSSGSAPTAMVSSSWPPGCIFIFQSIPKLLLLLSPVLFAHYLVSDVLPYYVWILAYTLILPLTAVIKLLSRRMREDREIKTVRARRVPQVYSPLPGGISLVLDALRSFNEGYIGASLSCCLSLVLSQIFMHTTFPLVGDSFAEMEKVYGQTFNLRAFWHDMVRSTSETAGQSNN